MTDQYHGVLEVDAERGVVYFHVDQEEASQMIAKYGHCEVTLLRIQGIDPKQVPTPYHQLDIRTGLYQASNVVS